MDKLECLKTVKIGQSAAKPRIEERSETRSKDRRVDIRFNSKQEEDSYVYFLKDSTTMVKEILLEGTNGYLMI